MSLVPMSSFAQSIDFEQVMEIPKKKPFSVSGGLNATSSYILSLPKAGGQPFTYQIGGSLNISLYETINIPLSLNLNNYGSSFSYPSLPNRLSIHPGYKWVKTHIGDVSMSFNPYTLSGHQFTGAGVELTPGKWQISLMGGRLKREVQYNKLNPGLMPTYARWGGGAKLKYTHGKFFAGASVFGAKDVYERISFTSDSLGVYPKKGLAFSVEGGLSLIKNLTLSAEYGRSLVFRDLRSSRNDSYNAFKSSLTYVLKKNSFSLNYERIDPGYETLGGYYFNNDYENLTLGYTTSMFEDKLSLALTGGVQRDNLDGNKSESNKRFVGSANIGYSPSDKLNLSLSASSFQGHRNLKSNFDYINAQMPYENLDTLNFVQLSNSVDFSANWVIGKSDKRSSNLSVSLSYNEAADRQGIYILPGDLTRFLNLSSNYAMSLIPVDMNINFGLNASNNYAALKNSLTVGPVLSVGKKFFKKKMNTSLSLSYNETLSEGERLLRVGMTRFSASHVLFEKHSLSFTSSYQFRDMVQAKRKFHSLMCQLSYNYSF